MIEIKEFVETFKDRYHSEPRLFSAPGRVNLIGEHTDYNDGFVMPFAIDRRTWVGIATRADNLLNVHTLTLDKGAHIRLDEKMPTRSPEWTTYVTGMATILREQGLNFGGADVLIDSDIPFGAGLSSSASLEMALGLAFSDAAGEAIDVKELAFVGQKVEHDFVGVRSGILDQFASGLSLKANALLIDCRSLETEYIPLEHETTSIFVVCDTQVKHHLASSAYNERLSECEQAVDVLSQHEPGLVSLRDLTMEMLHKFKHILPDNIARRCRHILSENARTVAAAQAFRRKRLTEAGRLMNLSHISLRDDYEVSCPELDLLAETAWTIPGVYGARMTGGGFGGCTINLLERSVLQEFRERTMERYATVFGRDPAIFTVKPSDGARSEN